MLFKKETQNVPCMIINAEVAQWVRALAPQAEGWVFVSQTRQTEVVKSSKGKNLQPFIGNGDVSIRVKDSRVGQKTTNKLKHQRMFCAMFC